VVDKRLSSGRGSALEALRPRAVWGRLLVNGVLWAVARHYSTNRLKLTWKVCVSPVSRC
jgi:hypothetical protein